MTMMLDFCVILLRKSLAEVFDQCVLMLRQSEHSLVKSFNYYYSEQRYYHESLAMISLSFNPYASLNSSKTLKSLNLVELLKYDKLKNPRQLLIDSEGLHLLMEYYSKQLIDLSH